MDEPYLTLINSIKESFFRKLDTRIKVVEEILNKIGEIPESSRRSMCYSFAGKGVIEAFCEGLATSDPTIVRGIFKVFGNLIPFGLLSTWNEVVISLDATIRVVHIFSANQTYNVVPMALVNMEHIILHIHHQGLRRTLLDVPRTLAVLRKVSQKINCPYIMDVIASLLEGRFYHGHIDIVVEFIDEIMININCWYKNCRAYALAKFILHGFYLCKNYSRMFKNVMDLSVKIVKDVFLRSLKGLTKEKITKQDWTILKAITIVFYNLGAHERREVIKLFFDDILSILQAFEYTVENQKQTELVRRFLVHVLSSLSNGCIQSDNGWSEKLSRCLNLTPLRVCYSKLNPAQYCPFINVSPIIFNYFNFVLVERPKVDKELLNSLCHLIAYHDEFTSEMMKPIWFLYAAAFMNQKEYSSQYILSTEKLIRLISNHSLEAVFTRRPLMIYWIFTAVKDHTAFKTAVLDVVLNRIDKCTEELQKLFSTDRSFRLLCLKYLMTCENRKKSTILTMVLFNPENSMIFDRTDSMIVDVWHFLPKLISNKAFVGLWLRNLNSVLNYCFLSFFMSFDKTLMENIASELMKMISTYFENSSSFDPDDYMPTIEFLSFLINKGEDCIEKYFLDTTFLEIIELCLTREEKALQIDIINIITSLVNFQIKTKSSTNLKEIVIKTKLVTKWLRGSRTLSRATLKLLNLYFRCVQTKNCVLKITFEGYELVLLYLEVHNICLMDEAYTTFSWICLREMLLYAKTINYEAYLITLIHTNDLIDRSLSVSKSWRSDRRLLEFLKVWIELLPPVPINKTATLKTIEKIATYLAPHRKNESELIDALSKAFGDEAVVVKFIQIIRQV